MFSSYVFAMYSAHFRDAAISAETSLSFDVPESVLGKRRRDEDDEGECGWKWRCIRSPLWVFEEPWLDRVESLVAVEEHLEEPEIVDCQPLKDLV